MSTRVTVDYKQIEAFKKKLDNLGKLQDEFLRSAAKELAARLLRKVYKITKPGNYPKGSGIKGGTLRRGWNAQLSNLSIQKQGNTYVIDIINPVEYGSYVEYGHRTRNHKGWVPGRFYLTKSELEMNAAAPGILEKKLQKWLKEQLYGK